MDKQADLAKFNPAYWPWGTQDRESRFLHTMIRVRDLDASVHFYSAGLGMKQIERYDLEAGRFSLVFLGFEGYRGGGVLELTHNWDQAEAYSHGSGYGHVAFGVPDIDAVIAHLEEIGAEISIRPKTMAPGAPHIAFARDPDGYQVELIQTNRNPSDC